MKQFTATEIQDRFEKLPKESQDIITSPEINNTIQSIGQKNGLLIDQIGELVDMIGLVILGLVSSKDFVKNFSSVAGVDNKTASAVANDINKEVLDKIRISMMSVAENMEKTSAEDLGAIGKAGGFTIEKETGQNGTGNDSGVTSADKAKILNDIEYPVHSRVTHTEPLVDQLLSGATATVEKKVVIGTPKSYSSSVPTNLPTGSLISVNTAKPPIQPPQKTKGPDLYREPIK